MNIQIVNKYQVAVIQDRKFHSEFEFSVEEFINQFYEDKFEDENDLKDAIKQYIIEDYDHIFDHKELESDLVKLIDSYYREDELLIVNLSEIVLLPELQVLLKIPKEKVCSFYGCIL